MSVFTPPIKYQSKIKLFVQFNLFIWIVFFTAYWSNAYKLKNGYLTAKSLGVWADGAAHLTYISAMAYQQTFPKYLPTYWGNKFIYPFVADGLSAILVKLGLDLFSAYSVMGMLLSITLVLGLKLFYDRVFNNQVVSVLGINIFLASGGLGIVYFILDIYHQGLDLITKIPKEYTRLDKENIWWLNVITGELIPQRAMLLGLIVGLMVLGTSYQILFEHKKLRWYWVLLRGALLGMLPIIHPHTLIALIPVIGWYFMLSMIKRSKQELKWWLMLLIPASSIGLPLIFGHIVSESTVSFFKWYPGWLAKSNHMNWWWFWIKNWGIFPLIVVFGWFKLKRRQQIFLTPFLFVFSKIAC